MYNNIIKKIIFVLSLGLFILFDISCFGMQIRKSDLDIKKKEELNGFLKIIIKGDVGNRTPFLKINLTENLPKVKRSIPIIYLEDLDTIYSLEGRIEEKQILIPIKQGDYFASIMNEELYGSNAFFIAPLLFQEDRYIGISLGFDENYNASSYKMNSIQSGKCSSRMKERVGIFGLFADLDINFNYCPKLKIVKDKITEVEITFSEERLDVWRSIFVVIPGIFIGLPLYGTFIYKAHSTVEIKYPEESSIPAKIENKKASRK